MPWWAWGLIVVAAGILFVVWAVLTIAKRSDERVDRWQPPESCSSCPNATNGWYCEVHGMSVRGGNPAFVHFPDYGANGECAEVAQEWASAANE